MTQVRRRFAITRLPQREPKTWHHFIDDGPSDSILYLGHEIDYLQLIVSPSIANELAKDG